MRFQCDWFAKSILGLTTEQQTMRSMMTLALAFGNFSVFTGMMALDWKRFQKIECKKIKDVGDSINALHLHTLSPTSITNIDNLLE